MAVLSKSVKFSPALMVVVRVLTSAWHFTDAGRSCVGVRGRIIADAFCGSGALGFASAAIAGMVSAGAAGGS